MEVFNSLSDSTFADSLCIISPTFKVIAQLPKKTFIENISSLAPVIIAVVNIILVFYIFKKNSKKDNLDKEKSRKLNLLKTIVLDYNMTKFYSFFQEISMTSNLLLKDGLTDPEKQGVNERIKDRALVLRQDFIDIFLAIDNNLYIKILDKTDKLVDSLTESIFDEGINLHHQPKYNELITKKIGETKTEIIKILFSYSG